MARHDTATRPRRRLSRPAALPLALLVAVAATGCDGTSAFSTNTVPPEVVGLAAESPVNSGESVSVAVRAVGAVAIDTLVVRLEGPGLNLVERLEGEPFEADMFREFSFDVPQAILGSNYTVSARAIDLGGLRSSRVETTVRIIDRASPSVVLSSLPGQVGQEDALEMQVSAADNIELRRVGVHVTGPGQSLVFADSVLVSGTSVQRTFVWNVPAGQTPGAYGVRAFATDQELNRGESGQATVGVFFNDETAPTFDFLLPEAGSEWGLDDVIRVRARVTDDDVLASASYRGIVVRGDPELGTDEEIQAYTSPAIVLGDMASDTTLVRDLTPTGQAEAGETVLIILEATDASGNMAADTLTVELAPAAEARRPMVLRQR